MAEMGNEEMLDRISERRVKSAERIRKLEAALREQHQWQCDAEALFMFYTDPRTGKIDCVDIAAEYGDSSMYENTMKALEGQEVV